MVDQLTTPDVQARAMPALEQLIAQENLEGYFTAFLIACKVEGLSPASIASYKKLTGHFVKSVSSLGIVHPKHLNATHVRMFLLKKQETCGPVAIHAYYRHVKRFCNWMVEEKLLVRSPMETIRPPRMPRTIIKPLSVNHLRSLLALCDEKTFLGLRNRAIILVFLDTGIRLAEMSRMQVDDLDFDRGIIRIMGKGARERIVAIQQRTQKALLQYLLSRKDRHRCVWVSEERHPLTHWGIEQMIHKLGKQAGLNDVRCSPHTFRHTAATMSLQNGAGEFQVQAMLGHSTLTMTRRYVSSLNSEKAAEAHKRFSPVEHLKL